MHRPNEINEILTRVDAWSFEDRVALAYQILRDMRKKTLADAPRSTYENALGLGTGDSPAPTDAEVQSYLSQRRAERHG